MKSLEDARTLAESMIELGRGAGREVVALLTDMDQPLGWAIGNAVEIAEARVPARRRGVASRPALARGSGRRAPRLALRSGHRRRAKARAAPSARSTTAPLSRRTSAGSQPRAATPLSTSSRRHRCARSSTADRAGFVARRLRARRRPRRARARRRPADEGGHDRPRRRDSLLREARRSGRGGPDRSPRSTRATRRAPSRQPSSSDR